MVADPEPIPEWLRRLGAVYGRLGAAGQAVLLAVSGGADSMALLHATTRVAPGLKMRVSVACLDHGLRSGSALEVDQVRRFCDGLSVPFFTAALGLREGPEVEARARQARYEVLEQLRVAHSLAFVVTAHTADDQAETVLMRLGRGASIRGLGAIRERTGHVLRPALDLRRVWLREYAAAQSIPLVDDPMNHDERFARVRVRQRLLPVFDALFPAGVTSTVRLAAHCVEDEAVLAELSDAAFDRLLLEDGSLDREGVLALRPAIRRRVLRSLLEDAGVAADGALIEQAQDAVADGAQLMLPGGLLLRTGSGAVRVVDEARTAAVAERALRPGTWELHAPSGLEIGVDVDGGTWQTPVVSTELSLSAPRPGDRMVGGGKLQDVLVDLRVPRELRAALPVVRGGDSKIVCVAGLVRGLAAGTHRVAARLAEGRTAPRWAGRYRVPW